MEMSTHGPVTLKKKKKKSNGIRNDVNRITEAAFSPVTLQ